MAGQGVGEIIEIGAGKALSGMVRRIDKEIAMRNVGSPADVAALCALMVSLSQFAADFADEILEIDLNPVLVHEAGAGLTVLDAIIVKRQ